MKYKYYELHEFDCTADIATKGFTDNSRVALFTDEKEAFIAKRNSESDNKGKCYVVRGVNAI